jgi:hypothetical protein
MEKKRKLDGKLTHSQRNFKNIIVKQVLSGKPVNGTRAIMESYGTKNVKSATVMASQNLKIPNIREAVEEALRAKGLDAPTLAGEAKKLATAKVEKVSADVKLRAIQDIWKLLGAYPDRKTAHLNVNLSGKIKDLSYQDAKKTLLKMNEESGVFIEEAE